MNQTLHGIGPFSSIGEFRIVENSDMVEYYTEKVLMGWKERFFSFKWFTKYKIIHKTRPDNKVIKFGGNLIMHPENVLKLKQEFDKRTNQCHSKTN